MFNSTTLKAAGIVLAAGASAAASGGVIYVNAAASSIGNGTSWADATPFLTKGLTLAQPGDQVWVARGTYRPDQTTSTPAGSNDRSARFVLKTGVSILGGFTGVETSASQRISSTNITVLSGDIGTQAVRADNSYGVVAAYGVSNALLDGFTIKLAQGDGVGTEDTYLGGGVRVVSGGAPIISNCRFEDNLARGGAGIACYGATMTVSNCTFLRGNAIIRSGGIDLGAANNVSISDCAFQSNSGYYGGGLYVNEGSTGTVDRCVFTQNASVNGGGISLAGFSVLTVKNTSFIQNECKQLGPYQVSFDGGAVKNWCTNSVFINCIFSGNKAWGQGGAFHDAGPSGSNGKLINCTIHANWSRDGGAVAAVAGHTPQVKNSILWGNLNGQTQGAGVDLDFCCVEGRASGGTLIISDPQFVNRLGTDNTAGTADDDLRLRSFSPCIDAANAAHLPAGTTTDVEGQARIVDGNNDLMSVLDMGAYEYTPAPPPVCYGDANGDRVVNFPDVIAVLGNWGGAGPAGDADLNGAVNFPDVIAVLVVWGSDCGDS